jgi:hypothetical protein
VDIRPLELGPLRPEEPTLRAGGTLRASAGAKLLECGR